MYVCMYIYIYMLSCNGIQGLIKNSIHVLHLCGYDAFGYWKVSAKRLHTPQQVKNKKIALPFNRKKKSTKSLSKMEDKDPKVYMRDVISNISKTLRYSTWDAAQEQLSKFPIRWDSYTINQVLKTHPPMEKAWLFFNWASRLKEFKHDQFTYTTMLDIFGEAGRISSMKFVFQQMQDQGLQVDAVTYTSLLHWLSKNGDLEGSLKIWEEMKVKGCCPTVVSYTAFMKILFDNNRSKEATDIYKEMLQAGFSPNCYTYTILMEYLAKAGKFTAVLEILNKMQEAGVLLDKAACNILVQRCSEAGETQAMNHILHYMKENFLVLRHAVYLQALEALKSAGECDGLLRETNPHLSLESSNEEGSSDYEAGTYDPSYEMDRGILVNLLAQKNFTAIETMLDGLISKKTLVDSALLSLIIQANCTNHRPTIALLAYKFGIERGISIERAASLSLMGYFIRNNSFMEVVEILREMLQARVSIGTYHISSLIYKLGCNHMTTCAEMLFDALPADQKNSLSFTALMGAYFNSGNSDKGLETFNTMRKMGLHTSPGTYKLLIVGLENAGRANESERYRKERKNMQSDRHCNGILSFEEGLSKVLFARDVVP